MSMTPRSDEDHDESEEGEPEPKRSKVETLFHAMRRDVVEPLLRAVTESDPLMR